MLVSVCRCQPRTRVLLSPCRSLRRAYAQQRTARTAKSAPQRSTTNPSPTTQLKNRNLPPATSTGAGSSVQKSSSTPSSARVPVSPVEEKAFAKLHEVETYREMEQNGRQLEIIRRSVAAGMEPWAGQTAVMDLRIPSKLNGFRALRDNFKNSLQNTLSMFRLASDFAFPGIVSKWRISPQLFRAQSTSEKAWVAPFRHELLDIYVRINQAIASGDKKTIAKFTAYEYQSHILSLLQRSRTASMGLTAEWSLTKLLSPVKIHSLRVFPLYTAPEEPRWGNRNVVQALVRFETLQTLTFRDARGRIVRPDGSPITSVGKDGKNKEEWKPEPRRVLEYLVCENKMFYRDGWYVRDQVFEGVKPRFKEIAPE